MYACMGVCGLVGTDNWALTTWHGLELTALPKRYVHASTLSLPAYPLN